MIRRRWRRENVFFAIKCAALAKNGLLGKKGLQMMEKFNLEPILLLYL